MSVITAEDIAAHGRRTLAEALDSLRGFWIADDRAYGYVGVRGMLRAGDWHSRLLLRVDGHRINAAAYDDASFDVDAIVDVGAVERIEVVRGPGSSLYGGSAVYAVVDVVTKRGRDWRGFDAEVGVGSGGLRRAAVRGGDRVDGLEWSFSASALASDGDAALFLRELATTTPTAGVSRDNDAERAQLLMFGARWRDWTLQTAIGHWDKQVPTGAYGTVLSDSAQPLRPGPRLPAAGPRTLARRRHLAAAGLVDRPGALRRRLRLRRRHRQPRRRRRLVAALGGDAGPPRRRRHAPGRRRRPAARAPAAPAQRRPGRRLPGHRPPRPRRGRLRAGRARAGADAQAQRRAARRPLQQLRHRAEPALRAIWRPLEGRALKLLAGRAFRPPNAYERHYDDGGHSQRASPALRAERMRSQELVWEGRLAPALQAVVSVYRNRLRGLIDAGTDDDGLIRYRNAGDVAAHGVEAELDARLGRRLAARLTASWQRSRLDGPAEPPTNSPQRMAGLALRWRAPADATLAAGLRAVSRTVTRAGSALPGYALLDLNATLPLGQRWRAALALRNALDRRWHVPAGPEHDPVTALPQPGRRVELSVGASF
ncbi:MAG: TonB-dependent receptor [Comamonadaceae bacterium]|nr:TonB-dependent receptor [Comamonadaceae bacterium]